MLRFDFFGFPLEISWTVLILAVFVMNSGLTPVSVVMWMVAAILSIVIHELGHAVMAERVGGRVERISLYALGGLTMWRGPTKGWRRFVVALAGSVVEIAVALLVFGLAKLGWFGEATRFVIDTPWRVYLGDAQLLSPVAFFLAAFVWVSFVWGAVNLLPIGGLDGSTLLAEVLEKIVPGRGRFHAAIIGLLVAALVAWILYDRLGSTFGPIIVLFFAIRNLAEVTSRQSA